MGGEAGSGEKEEQTHGPLPTKERPLQSKDDINIAGELDCGVDEEAEILVIREFGLIQKQGSVETSTGDPANHQDDRVIS